MPEYRSRTTTHGRNMAGARALWRATGMKDGDFDKPIIAIANSFTQFVPGHVHLKDMGQLVAREIEKAGGVKEQLKQQLYEEELERAFERYIDDLRKHAYIDPVRFQCGIFSDTTSIEKGNRNFSHRLSFIEVLDLYLLGISSQYQP